MSICSCGNTGNNGNDDDNSGNDGNGDNGGDNGNDDNGGDDGEGDDEGDENPDNTGGDIGNSGNNGSSLDLGYTWSPDGDGEYVMVPSQYVLFAEGQDALQLHASDVFTYGSVYSGADLDAYSGYVGVYGKIELVGHINKHEHTLIEALAYEGGEPYIAGYEIDEETGLEDLSKPIIAYTDGVVPWQHNDFRSAVMASLGNDYVTHQWWQTYNGPEVISTSNIHAQSGLQFTGNNVSVQGTIVSEDYLLISASNAFTTIGEANLYVADGNIGIYGDNINITGVIYAPNGTVQICGSNITIHGAVIAKEILISASSVEVYQNHNLSLAEYLEYNELLVPALSMVKSRYFGLPGVHSPTGNYSQTFTDMTVPTVLGDVTFNRTYNSLDYGVSNIGKGWTFSYDMKIDISGNKRTVVLPTGSVWYFTESNGVFTADDNRGTLKLQNGDYVLETLDQMRYVFNSSGHIKYVEDFKGNRVTISTYSDGKIQSLSDPAGASVSFGYSGDKLVSVTDNASDRTVNYSYSGDFLTQAIDAANMTSTYSYTGNGFLSAIVDNSNRTIHTITYDNSEYAGKVSTVTDVTGNVWTYIYDRSRFQTSITDSNGRTTRESYNLDYSVTTSTNELGYTERVTYSLVDGRNKYNEVQSSTDMYGNVTRYERDEKGNVVKTTYPDGSSERFTFDSLNNMTSHTNRSGLVTWYEYEQNGVRLLKEIRPLDGKSAYDPSSPEDFAITTYTYYADSETVIKGSVKDVISPLGDSQNFVRNEYGTNGKVSQTTKFIDGVPFTTQYTYDNVHRITQQIDPDGTVTDYVYNLAGQVLSTTVTNGGVVSVTQSQYDNLGRVVKEISPIGGEGEYFYNNEGFVWKQTGDTV